MALGSSVSNIITIVNITGNIIDEVNSYRSAPQHFQRLSIELGFISKLCSQILDLEPTIQSETIQVERIRAVVMQCLGPIMEFEKKMSAYTNTLGADAWKNNQKGAAKNAKSLMKKLHWTMIERKEVDELRAVLASELLVVNTMLTVHGWESFKLASKNANGHIEQLTNLISTTASVTQNMKHSLLQAFAQSTRIEEVFRSGQLSSAEQLKILECINISSIKSEGLTQDLLNLTNSQATTVNEISQKVKNSLIQTVSIKRLLKKLIKTIVLCTKSIIIMVERSTKLLLQLQMTLRNLETKLMQGGLYLPIVVFRDPFGERMAFPWQLCENWNVSAALSKLCTSLLTIV